MNYFLKKNHKGNKKGFTIVELLISFSLLIIVGIAVGTFSSDILKYSGSLQSSLSVQQDALNVIRRMVTELRTSSISNTGSYALTTVGTSTLSFYSDTDGNGTKEQIRYSLSADGKTLYKNIVVPTGSPLAYTGNGATSTIAHNIINGTSSPIFTYYDGNYDGSTSALAQPVNAVAVRLIKITFVMDTDTRRSPTPTIVTSQVSLRNVKDNL